MAEIRLQIPDDLIQKFQAKLGQNVKATDLAREALTLFNWAYEERLQGRLILSSDEEGTQMTRLAMHLLDQAAPKKTPTPADPPEPVIR